MTDAEEFAASAAEFNQEHAAPHHAAVWPCSFTLSTDPAASKVVIAGYGRPAKRNRTADIGGYAGRTIRAFSLLPSQIPDGATVALGTEFTVTADARNPVNVGTVWSCFELLDSDAGGEVGAVCFRMDN